MLRMYVPNMLKYECFGLIVAELLTVLSLCFQDAKYHLQNFTNESGITLCNLF